MKPRLMLLLLACMFIPAFAFAQTADLLSQAKKEGEVILCEECGAEYEVVNTDPVELSKVEESGYDESAIVFHDEEEE